MAEFGSAGAGRRDEDRRPLKGLEKALGAAGMGGLLQGGKKTKEKLRREKQRRREEQKARAEAEARDAASRRATMMARRAELHQRAVAEAAERRRQAESKRRAEDRARAARTTDAFEAERAADRAHATETERRCQATERALDGAQRKEQDLREQVRATEWEKQEAERERARWYEEAGQARSTAEAQRSRAEFYVTEAQRRDAAAAVASRHEAQNRHLRETLRKSEAEAACLGSGAGQDAATKIQAVVRKNNTAKLLSHRAAVRMQCYYRMQVASRRVRMLRKKLPIEVAELRGQRRELERLRKKHNQLVEAHEICLSTINVRETELAASKEALRLADIRRRAQLNDCMHKDRATNDNQWGAINRRWAGEKKESSWRYWWDDFLTREEILELPPYGHKPPGDYACGYGSSDPCRPSHIPHGNQLALAPINGSGGRYIPAERHRCAKFYDCTR